MMVLGARFRALAGARAALRTIRESVGVAPGDVAVRALGGTRYETPIDDFVLAGRFEDGDVPAVISAVHAHGGRVIERRTATPRVQPPASRAASARSRAQRTAGRATRGPDPRTRKRRRRPSAPLRIRTALRHDIALERRS